MPTLDMREQCPLMSAFTQEVIRIRPIATFTLPNKVLEDTMLMGYKIKENTTIMPCLRNSMFDETLWPEPNLFKPERFLDSNNNLIIAKPSHGWLPFGAGKRSCIGEKLTLTNMFLIQCRLIQKTRKLGSFDLQLKDGKSKQDLLSGDPTKIHLFTAQDFSIKMC